MSHGLVGITTRPCGLKITHLISHGHVSSSTRPRGHKMPYLKSHGHVRSSACPCGKKMPPIIFTWPATHPPMYIFIQQNFKPLLKMHRRVTKKFLKPHVHVHFCPKNFLRHTVVWQKNFKITRSCALLENKNKNQMIFIN